MEWADLRAHFPQVLVRCVAYGLILSVGELQDFDLLTWLALAGVLLLVHLVIATTVSILDRVSPATSLERGDGSTYGRPRPCGNTRTRRT
jgi:ABC-type tungstate transport system substrate-binding protein